MRISQSPAVLSFALVAGLALPAAGQEPASEGEPLAEALLGRVEAASRRAFDPGFRAVARARLAALPAEELRAREAQADSRGLGPLSPAGATPPRLVYTPVTPCRIIRTQTAGGALAAGAPRQFRVAGTGLGSQGGEDTGCNVPVGGAVAAMINFVAVNATGPGNLRSWPYSEPAGPLPTASIINYASIPGLNIANAVAVPMCEFTQSANCPNDIMIQADVSGVHVVADVVGYFSAELPAFAQAGAITQTNVSVCTQVAGAQVTIVAPSAGQIVVRSMASVSLTHTTGTPDTMILGIANTPSFCNFISSFAFAYVPPELPSTTYVQTVYVSKVFNVPAGTHTYHLNAQMNTGAGGDLIYGGATSLEATFHPAN